MYRDLCVLRGVTICESEMRRDHCGKDGATVLPLLEHYIAAGRIAACIFLWYHARQWSAALLLPIFVMVMPCGKVPDSSQIWVVLGALTAA